jgi:hypothetical protein
MVDVPIWVAIITALAGIIGAAIPQGATIIRRPSSLRNHLNTVG